MSTGSEADQWPSSSLASLYLRVLLLSGPCSNRPRRHAVEGASQPDRVRHRDSDPSTAQSGGWAEAVDLFAILTAASLPWSTSLAAIFNVAMLVCMVPFLDFGDFLQSPKRLICADTLNHRQSPQPDAEHGSAMGRDRRRGSVRDLVPGSAATDSPTGSDFWSWFRTSSHPSTPRDFHEGWMYVLRVGVAGGIAAKARRSDSRVGEAVS